MRLPGERRFWVIIGVIILVITLGAFSLQGIKVKEMHFLESVLYQILRPFQKIVTNVNQSINDYWTLVTNLKKVKLENQDLKKRVDQLELQLVDYNKITLENQRLRKLLAFKELVPYKTVGAHVIGTTPNNWVHNLIIDRGTTDGISAKMPVITYNGALVGHIAEATANTSRVVLITDVNFAVSGRVQKAESRAVGVVRGEAEDQDIVLMDLIPWDAEIEEDDLIVTSGLSENFPMDIPIGKVILVIEKDFGLTQQAEIRPFMSLAPIEEVLIITDF